MAPEGAPSRSVMVTGMEKNARKTYGRASIRWTSLEEALLAYTAGAATAGFSDDRSGSLENAKLADLVVLSEDIFDVHTHDVGDVQVDMTVVEGKVGYERRF